MRHLRKIFVVGTMCLFMSAFNVSAVESVGAQAGSPYDVSAITSDAEVVVSQYLTALSVGDMEVIRNLLGKDFLAQREDLLSNPTYAEKLRTIYQGATFVINGHEIMNSRIVAVNVEVTYGDLSLSKFQFSLEKVGNYVLIVGESEI